MTQTTLRESWSLLQVSAELPSTRDGRPVHPQTVRNWIVIGRKAPDGRVIKLRGRRFPGGWRVLPEDLTAFLDELTSACMNVSDPSGPPAPDPAPTTAARRRELEQADRELDRIGMGADAGPKPAAGSEARARRAAAK
jgi:hypothetical protein